MQSWCENITRFYRFLYFYSNCVLRELIAMLSKSRQFLILIVGIVYVYSICPLLCAGLEQKLCRAASSSVEHRERCCGNAADASEVPAESQELCCFAKFECIYRNESTARAKFLQIAVGELCEQDRFCLSAASVSSSLLPDLPHLFAVSLRYTIARRGPPCTGS